MLSRLALATRQGLRTSRVAPVAVPRLAAPAVSVPVSPWVRTYAKNNNSNRSGTPKKDSKPEDQPPPEPSKEPSSTSAGQPSAEDAATPSSEPSKSADGPNEAEQIPFDKLPDLTQGIPSTLAAELEQKQGGRSKSDAALQAIDPAQYERRGGGGSKEYVSTSERNRRWWTRFMLSVAGGGSVLGVLYLGRNWDDQAEADRHPDIPDGLTPSLWWQRVKARMGESVSYYQDPAFDKLLPDPDPSFQRPYTLVISLEDLLVHSEWSRQHGWRLAKRPGVDYFIRYLQQYYELVVWSSTSFGLAEGIVRKLDPFRIIMWPLFREATKFEDGEIVKV